MKLFYEIIESNDVLQVLKPLQFQQQAAKLFYEVKANTFHNKQKRTVVKGIVVKKKPYIQDMHVNTMPWYNDFL